MDEVSFYITQKIENSADTHTIRADLVSEGMKDRDARAFLRTYLLFWSRQGLLRAEQARDSDVQPASGTFLLAGHHIRLDCQERYLFENARTLLTSARCEIPVTAKRYSVCRIDDLVCVAAAREAFVVRENEFVPALKGLMTDEILADMGDRTALHGALLTRNGTAIFLSGPPGAGKTTLALAMTQSGFEIHADDVVLMDTDGTLEAVRFSPTLKSGSWNRLPHLRETIFSCPVHRRPDGKRVRYLPAMESVSDTIRLDTIVILDRRRRVAAKAAPVDPLQTLERLVAEACNPSRRLTAAQFGGILKISSEARGLRLTYSRLDDAVQLLCELHDAP